MEIEENKNEVMLSKPFLFTKRTCFLPKRNIQEFIKILEVWREWKDKGKSKLTKKVNYDKRSH